MTRQNSDPALEQVETPLWHDVLQGQTGLNCPTAFILYSDFDLNIKGALGEPEYSYHFVLNGFRSALDKIGSTIVINRLSDLDATLDVQEGMGTRCVLVCFMPPHQAPVDLRCPTLCVFAWEFGTIPDEVFGQDPRSDWRNVFARHGRAISLSQHTANLVREAMGVDFPITAIPVPLPERLFYIKQRDNVTWTGTIALHGTLYDSRAYGPFFERPLPTVKSPEPTSNHVVVDELTSSALADPPPAARSVLRTSIGVSRYYALMWYRDALRMLLPHPVTRLISMIGRSYTRVRLILRPPVSCQTPPSTTVAPVEDIPAPKIESVEPLQQVVLDGVVYTSVLNPKDGRKNWHDMLTAFCWAFRENPRVTLVIKMVHHDRLAFETTLAILLERLQPFCCRIVTLQGWLDDDEYDRLISATDYYVNTSSCEGLCLPLMEFMGAGRPAIAPDHTAMADYLDDENAFVLRYGLDYNVWPHDPRDLFRTTRYRLDWNSLVEAYHASYRVRLKDPVRYASMGQEAKRAMQRTCSLSVVQAKLDRAIGQIA